MTAPDPSAGIPAIIYAAKSTEDVHGSIPTQIDDCRAGIERAGGREIVGEPYFDEAKSAYHGARGDGLTMAKDAAAAAAAAEPRGAELWVQHTDRLARGNAVTAPHLVEVILWARKCGVRVRSVQDDSTGENMMMAAMMGERNYEDSRRKSEAVKSGMTRRAKRGQYNGGRPSYGYRFEGLKGDYSLVMVEAEAVIVRRIFEAFAAGRSLGSIARTLNCEDVRTQRGDEWRQGTITKMLANPMYVGLLRFNGEVVEGTHSPIVSESLWARVQALRAANARTPSGGRGRPPKVEFVLRGLLRCGQCDGPMVARSMEVRGRMYAYYVCDRRRRLGPDTCAQESIRRERIDQAVLDYFESAVLDVEATQREIVAAVERETAATSELRAQAERDERQAVERLARIRRDYMDGRLDADDWQAFRDDLTGEQEAARAKLAQLQEQEARVVEDAQLDAEAEALRYLVEIRAAVIGTVRDAQGVEAVRAALLALFEKFTLSRHAEPFERDVYDVSLMGVGGGYELEPHVREDAIAGYGPCGITPKPMRRSLGIEPRTNNRAGGRSCARSSRAAAGPVRTGRARSTRS